MPQTSTKVTSGGSQGRRKAPSPTAALPASRHSAGVKSSSRQTSGRSSQRRMESPARRKLLTTASGSDADEKPDMRTAVPGELIFRYSPARQAASGAAGQKDRRR